MGNIDDKILERKNIESFEDLLVWKEAYSFTLIIYSATKKFPREELFGIVSQMRRAVISVTSNIAEGFARLSLKEKLQFYNQAHGSLVEIKSQLYVSKGLKYLSIEDFELAFKKANTTHALLQGLIKSTRVRIQSKIT